jgi:hypothetical protein
MPKISCSGRILYAILEASVDLAQDYHWLWLPTSHLSPALYMALGQAFLTANAD